MLTSELENQCLNTFPEWLRGLAADAVSLSAVLKQGDVPEYARRYIGAALNYLFKSLDLIPDGIEDLGFLDDAFVLRVACRQALVGYPAGRDQKSTLKRLADETKLIEELLGKDYERLTDYVAALRKSSARGRSVDDIVDKEEMREAFLDELQGFAASYTAPTFSRDVKNIIKLQSFMHTRLPT